jgi:predicted DNA-binding ribbon-helix-helix protein
MKSTVIKRSIVLDGHKTSVSLEDAFWTGLKEIAHFEHVTLSKLVGGIDAMRKQSNLSSAIRLFVLEHVQKQSSSADDCTKSRTYSQTLPLNSHRQSTSE